MDEIIFNIHYNKNKVPIPHKKGESLEIPFKNFANTQKMRLDDFVFLYKTSIINYKSSRSGSKDLNYLFFSNKEKKSFSIFAYLIKPTEKKKNIVQQKESSISEQSQTQSQNQDDETKVTNAEEFQKNKYYNDIICPECETSAIIDIIDSNRELDLLKFNIYNCDNFHFLQNNRFNMYDDYYCRNSDKCNLCSCIQCQLTPPDNKLFICSCGSKVCPSCIRSHTEPGHEKIIYNDKNYYCTNHQKKYASYCLDCNSNLCESCKEPHKNHECFEYNTLKPRAEDIKNFGENIESHKKSLKNIVDYFKKLFDETLITVESYLKSYILIEEALLSRYKNGFINFQLLRNLNNNKIFNNPIFKLMEKRIESSDNSVEKFDYLRNIYKGIINIINNKKDIKNIKRNKEENINIINLNYKVDDVKSVNKYIKLFDPVFVKNNKDKFSVKINNEDQKELSVYFENKKNAQEINVILTENKENAVTDMSYMLNNCKNLIKVDLNKFNPKNITSMEAMFQMCPFDEIPSIISSFSIPNLTNVRAMFCKCLKIKKIPDLCNIFHKTNRINDISMLFNGCINLKEITNFNKWYAPNITDMSYLFNRCKEIEVIDFGKITSENITNMCGLFNCCENLKSIKNIPLKTKNTEDMSIMFQGCEKLETIDSIDKFNTQNVRDMSGIFSKCHKLKNIPKIGNWKMFNVKEIIGLFNECQSLEKIPDLGSWNMSQIKDASGMFYKCSSLKEVKGIIKWKFGTGTSIDNIFDQCSLTNIDKIKKAWREKK